MTAAEAGEIAAGPQAERIREAIDAEVLQVEQDGRHLLEVTLLKCGRSRNGRTYLRETVRDAVPLFEGCRAFVDHQREDALPERSVRDLAGYYRSVRFDEAEGALRGRLHLVPGNEWLFQLLREAENNPSLCGLSIDAFGEQDRKTGDVRAITAVCSVDIVTRPAAGGQVDRILASERPSHQEAPPVETQHPTESPIAEAAPEAAPDLAELIEQMRRERDHLRSELASVKSILSPSAPNSPDPGAELSALAEEIRRERDAARAAALLDASLREAALPEPVERKLRKRFAGTLPQPAALEEAIADEKAALAALTSQGQISGLGFEKPVSLGMSEYEQLQAAFDGLFDIYESDAARAVPRLSGVREAFRIATGVDIQSTGGVDRPILESYALGLRNKVRSGGLRESDALLREADVTTSSFSFLLGTSMNKRLLSDYQAWPSEWQKFSTIVGIKDFKQQDRVRLGAFGSLSTVSEDAAYTTLTLSDTRAIYSASKRGNLVQVTRETIVNDDLYAIKQIPQKLAVAAAFTLAEFVYGLLSPNGGAIYDTYSLFDSVHHLNTGVAAANLSTANSGAALTSTALQAAVIAMRKQRNMASKPIGLKPRYLLVPPDLEFTAMTILKSAGLPGGNNNDINPMMGYAEPIVSPQLNSLSGGPASTTVWIAVADPRVIDTVELGFVGGQANPVLLIQDMPLYGLNFTQDTISYKVRHEYGGAVVDYRGFYLGNN